MQLKHAGYLELKKKTIIVLLVILMFLFALPILNVSAAVTFTGSGTAKDPYIVETAQQLSGIRDNLAACYRLGNTIDMKDFGNFRPIGTLDKPFTGSFTCDLGSDGLAKYAIKNINITVAESAYAGPKQSRWEAGLFGAVTGGTLSNIYVLNAVVKNNNFGDNTGSVVYGDFKPGMDEMGTGILAGFLENATVKSCIVTGTIDSRSNHCGGFVGHATSSTISKSYSKVTAKCVGLWSVGSFSGSLKDTDVTECFAEGSLDDSSATCGAFSGSITNGMINNCYTTVSLSNSGRNFIGVAYESYIISNCYSTTSVKPVASSPFKGVAASISNSYILSDAQDAQSGFFTAVSKADLLNRFSTVSGWITEAVEYPQLKSIKVISDEGKYVPGKVKEVKTSNSSVASNASKASTVSNETTASTVSGETTKTVSNAELISLIDSLPAADKITLANKNDIMTAKKAYDAMSGSEKIELPDTAVTKLLASYNALMVPLLTDIANAIDKLPMIDKLTKADKEKVLAINEDFNFLNDEAKSTISTDLKSKLEAAVKKVNSFSESSETATASTAISSIEWLVIIILSILTILTLVFNGFMTVVVIKSKKKSI